MNEKDLKTISNDYNAGTAKTQGNYEIYNSTINRQKIVKLIESGRGRDLHNEDKKNGEPVIITGSGPGFDRTVKKLKDWKGGIICHYSQAVTLMYHGVEPDYIVCLDAICNWEGLQCIDWSKTKTKLITHPGIWPSIIDGWPNEFLFFRQNVGINNKFTKTIQKVMYSMLESTLEEALNSTIKLRSLINTEVTMFACTPPVQLVCASIFGYGTAFLTGLDFCYYDDKMRFTNYEKIGKNWHEKRYPLRDDIDYVETINGYKTEPLHMFYKKNFLSSWRMSLHPTVTTDNGAITELPYADFDTVLKKQGKGIKKKPRQQIIKAVEKYLAVVGCFVVEYKKGLGFIEAENLDMVKNYIKAAQSSYICDKCENKVTARDGKDHAGDKCERCGGKLRHVNDVDYDANIKKISKLMEYAEGVK